MYATIQQRNNEVKIEEKELVGSEQKVPRRGSIRGGKFVDMKAACDNSKPGRAYE